MFCSNCGEELKEGAKFCQKCGAPVNAQGQAPAQNVAPQQVQNAAVQPVQYGAPKAAPVPAQYAAYQPMPMKNGKVGVGVGSVIMSSIFALITFCFALAGCLGRLRLHPFLGKEVYVLAGLSALLLVSCLLFKVSRWIPFIPILVWTFYDIIVYKKLFDFYAVRMIIHPNSLRLIMIVLVPVAFVLFTSAVFSKGAVRIVTGVFASIVYAITSCVGVAALLRVVRLFGRSRAVFKGIDSERLPLYVRFAFYFCCAVISLCIVFAKARPNKKAVSQR